MYPSGAGDGQGRLQLSMSVTLVVPIDDGALNLGHGSTPALIIPVSAFSGSLTPHHPARYSITRRHMRKAAFHK